VIRLRGVVLTEAGVPVQGANVTIKQTEHGTITNAKGEFELSAVVPGSTLIFSYVGYAPQSFEVKDGSQVQINMKVASNELDKAVVQAYGLTTQRLTTSDIGKVTAQDIERQPVMNPLLALQGKVAGLDVNMTSGYASAPVKVELRGRAAINPIFTSDPLYIIDGVPLTVNELSPFSSNASGSVGFAQALSGPAGGQSPFFSINPSDIESIEVLKDADATAIYGSRGANGVILVTTKKGQAGKTKLNLSFGEGVDRVDRFWGMMNTSQYLNMRRQAFYFTGGTPDPVYDFDINGTWDTSRYTNWQKVIYGGVGKNTNLQGNLTGGDERTNFRLGAGYTRATGVTAISGADQRGSLSLGFSHHSIDHRLSINSSTQFSYTQSNLVTLPGNAAMAPDAPPIFDSTGNLNYSGWGGPSGNISAEGAFPFGGIKQPYVAKTNFLNSGLNIEYDLSRSLKFSANFGCNIGQDNQTLVQPIASLNPVNSPKGSLTLGSTRNVNWIIEPQLTYASAIGRGRFAILIGATSEQNNSDVINLAGKGYTSDLLVNSIASAATLFANEYYGEYKYFGVFGRVTYAWESKIILNINGRRDGSSRFGPNKQYGNFGSIGCAWILTSEDYLRKVIPSLISFFKLRGSFGLTGSDAVPDYSYESQYSASNTYPYANQSVLVPIINPNPSFRWQSTKKLEGAIDLGLLNERVTSHIAWYRNRCGNQLVPFPTPLFTGFPYVIENSPALVQNTGWEISLSANLIKTRKFTYSLTFNTAFNQNKLVSYPDFSHSPFYSLEEIGKPLNMAFALHYTGVDPETGIYTFLDKNHDGQISTYPPRAATDDRYIINLTPKFIGGLGMDFQYGGLGLSLQFNIKAQDGRNAFINAPSPGILNSNQPTYIIGKQWRFPGDIKPYEKSFTYSPSSYSYFSQSDGIYTDASFVRLSNLSISYNIPSRYLGRVSTQGCSIFLHASNLFVLTKYKGLDPETQNFGALPPIKTILAGIVLNF